MLEGSYGKEPFDLRLTVLRLIRNMDRIFALTVVGTLLFGGGYYVKNVLLRPAPVYAATSTYKVQYVIDPNETGAYYVNETSWNTFVHTQEFLNGVQKHLQQAAEETGVTLQMSEEEISATISAKLPSDLRVPTTTVICENPQTSMLIAGAVEQTMMKEFVEGATQEIVAIRVIDPADTATEVLPDVRPLRAFVLSGLLSFFFVLVFFLLRELGADSIWLPATISRRYGLPVLGTIKSPECSENIAYLFRSRQKNAVCSVDQGIDTVQVAEAIQKLVAEPGSLKGEPGSQMAGSKGTKEWIPVPTPLLCAESCEVLRNVDGILLAVRAGSDTGKPLEYVLEFMKQQDCKITAVILWDADEALLRAYYHLPGMPKGK